MWVVLAGTSVAGMVGTLAVGTTATMQNAQAAVVVAAARPFGARGMAPQVATAAAAVAARGTVEMAEFGGGGGAGISGDIYLSGGNGGFGAGGGSAASGGAWWTHPGRGGTFGGRAEVFGGGGGALGGAIFSNNGQVHVHNSTFFNNFVTRGVKGGGSADNGADAGGAIFVFAAAVEFTEFNLQWKPEHWLWRGRRDQFYGPRYWPNPVLSEQHNNRQQRR